MCNVQPHIEQITESLTTNAGCDQVDFCIAVHQATWTQKKGCHISSEVKNTRNDSYSDDVDKNGNDDDNEDDGNNNDNDDDDETFCG